MDLCASELVCSLDDISGPLRLLFQTLLQISNCLVVGVSVSRLTHGCPVALEISGPNISIY
jgi:hypothetical protein